MENRHEEMTEQFLSDEAARYRAVAEAHKTTFKETQNIFKTTGLITLAILVVIAIIGIAWFVFNDRVKGVTSKISARGQADFALATVGNREQGVYDDNFGLSSVMVTETIGGTEYYIASGKSSFRVDSDKNFNNFLANADLRPGNRGTFDLYIICRSDKREMVLSPIFSAWYENDSSELKDVFLEAEGSERRIAGEFLKGHILLFANMDEKGMYSGSIDYTKNITLKLSEGKASQENGVGEFLWGKSVYKDSDTEVYCLPVYWVWPEQFGNFIYTGNSYNKNLFAKKEADYSYFLQIMQDSMEYKKFFYIEGEGTRPNIDEIISGTDYNEATRIYGLYSDWYNAADEKIGEWISYIELGFEIAQDN